MCLCVDQQAALQVFRCLLGPLLLQAVYSRWWVVCWGTCLTTHYVPGRNAVAGTAEQQAVPDTLH
jgi:hypothetical protein